MGGMISAYAISKPEIFGGAACLSTHWPRREFCNYLVRKSLAISGDHKIYFDRGTVGYDSTYEPGQAHMDSIMEKNGFIKDDDWKSLVFEGEDHLASSWRKRLHIPLEFLLKPR